MVKCVSARDVPNSMAMDEVTTHSGNTETLSWLHIPLLLCSVLRVTAAASTYMADRPIDDFTSTAKGFTSDPQFRDARMVRTLHYAAMTGRLQSLLQRVTPSHLPLPLK